MSKMKKLFKRYRIFLLILTVNIIFIFIEPQMGKKALTLSMKNLIEMLGIIPPIFLILGLLDVWIKKEVMIQYMGKDSGIKGALISFIIGATAAGPLYAAFPIAGILLKKGTSIFNVLIFIGAWSTLKIPLFLLESSTLGYSFGVLRFGMNLIGIPLMAFFINKLISEDEKNKIYEMAEKREN